MTEAPALSQPTPFHAKLQFHRLRDPRFFGLEAGPADGPLVILLHGFPDLSWGWRHQVVALAAQGYHVIAPDQRGYGCSFRPEAMKEYRLSCLTDDVLRLAEAYGASRFRLAGHDWGGIVAWWTAASHPGRLEQVAIVNAPHPDAWSEVIWRHPLQILRSWYVAFFQLPRLPEFLLSRKGAALLRRAQRSSSRPGTFPQSDDALYASAFSHPPSLRAMLNYYRALRFPHGPAPKITVPLLLLWGDRDSFLIPQIAAQSLTHCTHARAMHFPEATHWLPVEEPGRVSSEILSFFGPAVPE